MNTIASKDGTEIYFKDWGKGPVVTYKDLAFRFYGANRAGAKVSRGILDQFWLWSMQSRLKNAYESVKAFSETPKPISRTRSDNGTPLQIDGEAAPALRALVSTFNIVESSHL